MTQYCRVENDVIVEGPRELPENTATVSGFNLLSDEDLRAYGWYPLVDVPQPDHDPVIERAVRSLGVVGYTIEPAWTLEPLSTQEALTALQTARARAVQTVNREAGETRAKFMTAIPGQESTYLMKEAEARAWVTATNPVDTDYPILHAEATACGLSMAQTVNIVLTTAGQFRALAALIEGLRRGAIVAIEAATTTAEIDQALNINWP